MNRNRILGLVFSITAVLSGVAGYLGAQDTKVTKVYWVGPEGTVMGRTQADHTKYQSRYAMLDSTAIKDMEDLDRIVFLVPNTRVEVTGDIGGRFQIRVLIGEFKDELGFVLSRDLRQGISQ